MGRRANRKPPRQLREALRLRRKRTTYPDALTSVTPHVIATSTPLDNSNVYMTPADSPTPVPEGEESNRTPPVSLSPPDDVQLIVTPKRKVETMEMDMGSGTELPALQKKARANSGNDSDGDFYQWDDIPSPKRTEDRTGSLFPWGNETLVLSKPLSDFGPGGDVPCGSRAGKLDDTTTSGGPIVGGRRYCWRRALCRRRQPTQRYLRPDSGNSSAWREPFSASHDGSSTQRIQLFGGFAPLESPHFESPSCEEATEPYRIFAGRMMLDRTDWTHYAQQDEARPGVLHLEWPESLRTVGQIRIPAGYEGTYWREYSKPHARTFHGRVLRRKNGMKTAMLWGNVQERKAIRRTMREAASALRDDRDWFGPLIECHSDPEEGYLHTVLAFGEVLPFSLALAVAYEYPCTLGQQQPDLHERVVYSMEYP